MFTQPSGTLYKNCLVKGMGVVPIIVRVGNEAYVGCESLVVEGVEFVGSVVKTGYNNLLYAEVTKYTLDDC